MTMTSVVYEAFAPHRDQKRLVGVEIEAIPHIAGRPVPPVELAGLVDAQFSGAARPSFEPGGQWELSPAPTPATRVGIAAMVDLMHQARRLASRRDIELDLLGVDQRHDWYDIPLRLATPRYLAMQRMLGHDGRRMMRLTASLQICIDIGPATVGVEQWLVANLAGPALSCEFVNSGRAGRHRTSIWRAIDPSRTGYDGRTLDATNPVGAYAAFARSAPRLPIPEAVDDRYHLTTLFPPVRPRGGYLEIRYLDTQPTERAGYAISSVVALMYDERARRDALDLLSGRLDDLDADWEQSVKGISTTRGDLLEIAHQGIRRLGLLGPDTTRNAA